jgi:DNA-binding XRE family transcriptional regulator
MPKKNTPPADYPQAVLLQIQQLAQNIAIARKRRKETQAQWAQRLGVSQPTMARIERGDPSVAMASYVMCMWLINQAQGLADLIAPQADLASLEREVARTRKRSPSAAKAPAAVRAKAAASSAAADSARSHALRPGLAQGSALAPAQHQYRVAEASPPGFARSHASSAPSKPLPAPSAAAGLAALISGTQKKERP